MTMTLELIKAGPANADWFLIRIKMLVMPDRSMVTSAWLEDCARGLTWYVGWVGWLLQSWFLSKSINLKDSLTPSTPNWQSRLPLDLSNRIMLGFHLMFNERVSESLSVSQSVQASSTHELLTQSWPVLLLVNVLCFNVLLTMWVCLCRCVFALCWPVWWHLF